MERFSDLDAVLDHVWSYVTDAASDARHPFRTPTFGTSMDGPNVRTVVLREVEPSDRLLGFHTDRRTSKVAEIRAIDRIAWHGWDRERSQQLRLFGRATVHTDDAYADALWDAASVAERMLYVRSRTPGTPADAPESGLDVPADPDTLDPEDVAEGRRTFAAVRTVIDEIQWLHLHEEGHYRARFQFDPLTETFDGDWVIP